MVSSMREKNLQNQCQTACRHPSYNHTFQRARKMVYRTHGILCSLTYADTCKNISNHSLLLRRSYEESARALWHSALWHAAHFCTNRWNYLKPDPSIMRITSDLIMHFGIPACGYHSSRTLNKSLPMDPPLVWKSVISLLGHLLYRDFDHFLTLW